VVFGASGDLTSRLLVPALYNLSRTHLIPENFALIGVARSKETSESWRDHLHEKLKSFAGKASEFNEGRIKEEAWNRLAGKMSYVQGDLTQPELYEKLRAALSEAEKVHGTEGNVIFYLALLIGVFFLVSAIFVSCSPLYPNLRFSATRRARF
jgi:glucose-6-phosphate 1-dehydrogenase